MLDNISQSIEWLEGARIQLELDPSLEQNADFRASLAETGYRIETLLSEEDD